MSWGSAADSNVIYGHTRVHSLVGVHVVLK